MNILSLLADEARARLLANGDSPRKGLSSGRFRLQRCDSALEPESAF